MRKKIDDIIPKDHDLESVVLGSCILEKEAQDVCFNLLTKDCFDSPINQLIFESILKLNENKNPIEIITLSNELKRSGNLELIGGTYAITQLTNRVASTVNIQYHCLILLQLYFKRRLIKLSDKIRVNSFDSQKDVFEIFDETTTEINNITNSIKSTSIISTPKVIDKVLEEVDIASKNNGIVGYSTGIKNLDDALFGLRNGLKYCIAGRPGMGKSSLAKSICINLTQKKIPGIFFSLEMTKEQFMSWCISEILLIPGENIQKGRISFEEKKKISELKNSLFANCFFIDDRGGLRPKDIRSTIKNMVEKYDIKWMAIDYLGLMKTNKDRPGASRENIVSELTEENKNIIKEFNLVGIEINQLNRSVDSLPDKRPNLSHLKDSGSLEATADVVIFPYRPEYYGFNTVPGTQINSAGYAELIIAKNKYGPRKAVMAKFNGNYTRFYNNEDGKEIRYSDSPNDTYEF